jgi:hypothetical protein
VEDCYQCVSYAENDETIDSQLQPSQQKTLNAAENTYHSDLFTTKASSFIGTQTTACLSSVAILLGTIEMAIHP